MANSNMSAQDHANAILTEIPGSDATSLNLLAIHAAEADGYEVRVNTTGSNGTSIRTVEVKKPGERDGFNVNVSNFPNSDPSEYGTSQDWPLSDRQDPPESDIPSSDTPDLDTPTVTPPPQGEGDDAPVEPSQIPPDPSDVPPEQDTPPPDDQPTPPIGDETPPENEEEPKKKDEEDSDAMDDCNYCTPASKGGWWSDVPILGDIVDGLQDGLHLITTGVFEGDVWKVINGAFQVYDAASDILVVKRIVKKLASGAFKEAMKELFDEVIQRKIEERKEQEGLNTEELIAEAIADWIEEMSGGEWPEHKKKGIQKIVETVLDLNKPDAPNGGPLGTPTTVGINNKPNDRPNDDVRRPDNDSRPNDQNGNESPDSDQPGGRPSDDDGTDRPDDNDDRPDDDTDDNTNDDTKPDSNRVSDGFTNPNDAIADNQAEADRQNTQHNKRGPLAENAVIENRRDEFERANHNVQVTGIPDVPDGTTQIDVETSTQVVEVKSGAGLPEGRQPARQQAYANSQEKDYVVAYNRDLVPQSEIDRFRQEYPNATLEPWDFSDPENAFPLPSNPIEP